MPAAVAAPAPPDEPPGVIAASCGLSVAPCRSFSVNQRIEKAGVLVRPTITEPEAPRLRTTEPSSGAIRSR